MEKQIEDDEALARALQEAEKYVDLLKGFLVVSAHTLFCGC